ncbi:MOSC domain-containing protein [Rhizobium sp. PAMB 3182]
MQVSDLFIYPLKSARGIRLPYSKVDAFGLSGDRRMMIVDGNGRFITQRELPSLARIDARPGATSLLLTMEGKGELLVAPPQPDHRMEVMVWKSRVNAAIADDGVNAKLSQWFGTEVKLAFFDADAHREASADWAGEGTPVTFADGFQVLVTTAGSLNAINANLHGQGLPTVPMDRFRPNIVIDCEEPFAEDRWAAVEIGGIRFDFVKPCVRCVMTTQDQKTGSREIADPMPALRKLRMSADERIKGVLFGWNAVPRGEGRISAGDEVRVIDERGSGWKLRAA